MSSLRSLLATDPSPKDIVNAIAKDIQQDAKLDHCGSFSASIYDTAWISMIRRKESGLKWLFPKSFDFVLRSQQTDGTWESYASPIDGILNTLAALLALLVHRDADEDQADLSKAIEAARNGLDVLLQTWSVSDTDHVGFELLVPSLLEQIEQHGIQFDFPGKAQLLALREKKKQKFKVEMLCSKRSTTLLHSLEAFVGHIDFDKVRHHCDERLGIFGSPAATAAYLVNCSEWDFSAARYLRTVIQESVDGGVPSAFPTCLFESSWALSTVLPKVVDVQDLDPSVVESLTSFYQSTLEEQGGVVGFAPGILEDADDTARVLLTLGQLGVKTDLSSMIAKFETASCFRTFELERNPSFSANCNVLLTLLSHADVDEYSSLVQHTAEYLLGVWNSGKVSDKWNLSPYYSSMLLTEVLITFLERVNEGRLQKLPGSLVGQKIPTALCQILSKTLSEQNNDGSWNHSTEQTAYSTIAIARCLSLPWSDGLRQRIAEAHSRACSFFSMSSTGVEQKNDYVWVEKVTFGSALLQKVYPLTAINMTIKQHDWIESITTSFTASPLSTKMRPMLSRLPLFSGLPLTYVEIALVEATRLVERLREVRTDIFPRDEMPMTKDEYLQYIPLIWTACNQAKKHALSPESMWEMIVLSMLNYQIDEYMETVVQDLDDVELEDLIERIRKECGLGSRAGVQELPIQTKAAINGSNKRTHEEFSKSHVGDVIGAYIKHIRQHLSVLAIPDQDQQALAATLYEFLLSHIAQNSNSREHFASKRLVNGNGSLANGHTAPLENGHTSTSISQQGFLRWVRGSGADSTSCPFSFRLFTALIARGSKSLFSGPRPRYLAQALAAHLATLCRMYNDCGSAARDAEEGSLNSLDFAEFGTSSDDARVQKMKDELLGLAEFERGCMKLAFEDLGKVVSEKGVTEAIGVFVDVTDLFGQIYVQRDIASRMKKQAAIANGKTG